MTMILMVLLCASSFAKIENPCDVFEYTTVDYDRTRSRVCESLTETCDNFDETKWYRFEGNLSVSSDCPTNDNACGSQNIFWINVYQSFLGDWSIQPRISDTKLLPNGSEEHTVCLKHNADCCISTFKMLSKQCNGYRVYDLGKRSTSTCGRYCTDDLKIDCPTSPIYSTPKQYTENRNSSDPGRNTGVSLKTSFILLYISLIMTFVMDRKWKM